MRRVLRAMLFAASLVLAAGATSAADQAKDAESEWAASGRILVMLHLPAPHYRAETNASGSYDDRIAQSGRRRQALRIARAHGLKLVTDWAMPMVGVDCYVMEASDGRSAAELAQAISKDRSVAWAEPLELYRAQGVASPNDPLFRLQPASGAWRLAELHAIATGRGVRVAIVDSRIDRAHPDLKRQIAVSRDLLSDGSAAAETHGTGIAGVIAARAGDGLGVVGVAPQSRLMALRACAEVWNTGQVSTVCDTFSLAKALVFAMSNRAQVINLSLSGPRSAVLAKLLDVAFARGIVVVAAYDRGRADGGFPASHRGVVAVSAEPAPAGRGVYVAPGRDVLTAQPGGGWGTFSGNSYAAAHVSGLFALLRERGSRSASPGLAFDQSGVIDACATLARGAEGCDCACVRLATPTR
jgi:subtilisin family serine protease